MDKSENFPIHKTTFEFQSYKADFTDKNYLKKLIYHGIAFSTPS